MLMMTVRKKITDVARREPMLPGPRWAVSLPAPRRERMLIDKCRRCPPNPRLSNSPEHLTHFDLATFLPAGASTGSIASFMRSVIDRKD